MPVTIYPANVQLAPFSGHVHNYPAASSPTDLLKSSVHKDLSASCKEIFQSSFQGQQFNLSTGRIYPKANSFVNTICSAYNQHHHLVLRPDDVWVAILTQFNFYVNAHAEELRHLFVQHEGKKELVIEAVGTRYTVDFGEMARQMTDLLQENVLDKDLQKWIIPEFTTTEDNDRVVASVIMMSTLQSYFSYKFSLRCGLPAVTLLGEKADWEVILKKIEKLAEFGKETQEWSSMLRAVLTRFVKTFDEPESEDTLDFWNRICHYSGGGSGPTYLSGWINAFCFFEAGGKVLWHADDNEQQSQGSLMSSIRGTNVQTVLKLDGVLFHKIDTQDIPQGYASVPVKLDDNGNLFNTRMVAGHVGIRVGDSGVKGKDDKWWAKFGMGKKVEHNGTWDVLQPVAGWWLFDTTE